VQGPVEEAELLRTFNAGVGLCAVVSKDAAAKAIEVLTASGERAFELGVIEARPEGERVRFV